MSEKIKILTDREEIVAIADAVRSKTGSTNEMTLGGIISGINGIQTGVDLPELTNPASETEVFEGYEAIDSDGNKITGTMPNNGSIFATFDGLTTKSYTIPQGYTSGGTVSLDDTIDTEVDEQADLINQIKTAVDSLPEAGSGSSTPSGVCPSLTITGATDISMPHIVYSQNGNYIRDASYRCLPVTIYNIDIGKPFYFAAVHSWGVVCDGYENLEIIMDDLSLQNLMFCQCTSTSPATITLSKDD